MSAVPESAGEHVGSDDPFEVMASNERSNNNINNSIVVTETLITEEDESANLNTSQIDREMATNRFSDLDQKSLLNIGRKISYKSNITGLSQFSDPPMM